MKRKFLLVSVMILLIALVGTTMVACDDPTDPANIDAFFAYLDEVGNYAIRTHMSITGVGTSTIGTFVDNGKVHMKEFAGDREEYTELVGDTVYTYTNVDGVWTKDGGKPATADTNKVGLNEFFKSEDFEWDEANSVFKQKDGTSIDYQEMSLGTVTIELGAENQTGTIKATASSEGYTVSIAIEITEIGKTTVTLPTVA